MDSGRQTFLQVVLELELEVELSCCYCWQLGCWVLDWNLAV
jgi:hypothetical protein